MGLQILGTGSNAPDNVVRNEDLVALGMDPQWIVQRTGIRERRHAPPARRPAIFASPPAARRSSGRESRPKRSTWSWWARSRPITRWLRPRPRCKIGSGLSCGAIEISSACAGFVYALATASQFIATGASRKVLAIGGDCNSRVVDASDPKIYPLFGDGAGAVVLAPARPSRDWPPTRWAPTDREPKCSTGRWGRRACPPRTTAIDAGSNLLRMDGKGVFKWAARILCDTIPEVLAHAGMKL